MFFVLFLSLIDCISLHFTDIRQIRVFQLLYNVPKVKNFICPKPPRMEEIKFI